jgi:hypothetical protein
MKPTTREISAMGYAQNNAFFEHDKNFVAYIEEGTGIQFKKNQNSNSWYGVKAGKEIRISDHFNKKTDQEKFYFNEDADYIIAKINGTNPFERFSEGDIITHTRLGNVEFVAYNGEQGYVEVTLKDGSAHKYDEEKFAIAENF